MPFTPEAPQFLFENYSRNDKEWFRANKAVYEKEILTPFAEIITELTPLMKETDPEIVCDPKKVSRLYRDVRLIKDGMFFRKSVWCSFMRRKERFDSKPEFYVWISDEAFGWGCGYYMMPVPVMESVRKLILSGDRTAMSAIKAYEGQEHLVMTGEKYKRDRFPQEPERLKNWLCRKRIGFNFESDDPELFFSPRFISTVKEDLAAIAPVYKLFIKAEEQAAAEKAALIAGTAGK